MTYEGCGHIKSTGRSYPTDQIRRYRPPGRRCGRGHSFQPSRSSSASSAVFGAFPDLKYRSISSFFPGKDFDAGEACEAPLTMRVPILLFALLTALLGIFPAPILRFFTALAGGVL